VFQAPAAIEEKQHERLQGQPREERMASVAIRDVRKAFGATAVIHGVDISIRDGEFVVLVGPSGCGKSTLLRMIAGLENITAGEIRIGERIVNNVPPKERDVAMVFQNYALYPHMTVAANMAFSMKLRGAPKKEIDERVSRAAAILGLSQLLERYPRQLSGGQRQRVAMGRAIVRDPQVFLFDEPLSNLDAKLRVQMRTEIKELHQRLKTTTIYVTHDQIEAMTMADKIVVMHDGRVEQIGAPLELYDRPDNLFVAGFIGSPAMNMIKGRIRVNGSASFENSSGVRFVLGASPTGSDGRPIVYGVRPEHFLLSDDGADAEVQVVEPTGSELQVVAKLGGDDVIAVFRERHQFKPGDKIRLKPDPRLIHLFDETTGKRLNIQ
jgi:multiple sugar transport system ATP-binding protein